MSLLTEPKVDWLGWYERYEQMLACYNPGRESRVHLLLTIPELPDNRRPRILDLGAGPGSTSFSVLRHYPRATITAVEADLVLIEMGRRVIEAQGLTDRVEYRHADLRDTFWWSDYLDTFDLVVSATALHWLNAEHHEEVCRRIYQILKPGGWFVNCDHVASHHPAIQEHYNRYRDERQARAFRALGAERWDDYFAALARDLGVDDINELRGYCDLWEGSDDGLPKPDQLAAVERAGFELVDVYWQELGEAILGGRRPPCG